MECSDRHQMKHAINLVIPFFITNFNYYTISRNYHHLSLRCTLVEGDGGNPPPPATTMSTLATVGHVVVVVLGSEGVAVRARFVPVGQSRETAADASANNQCQKHHLDSSVELFVLLRCTTLGIPVRRL